MTFESFILDDRNRIIRRVVFWLLVWGFYILQFGYHESNFRQSMVFVTLLLPVTIAASSVIIYLLVPRFLLKGRYWLFSLLVVYTLIVALDLQMIVLVATFMFVADFSFAGMNASTADEGYLLVGMFLVIVVATAGSLLKHWYKAQRKAENLALERYEAELKLREAELRLLKGQLHPHFLFNSLNALYDLTLRKTDDAPERVLQISEMLQYVLYRSAEKDVALSEELDFVRNYIRLEQMRLDDRLSVTTQLPEASGRVRIAPLLLIPFVENAFKHAKFDSEGKKWIAIECILEGGFLHWIVQNSAGEPSHPDSPPKASGIGLANVTSRLDILHPGNYELSFGRTGNVFRSFLRVPIGQEE